MKLIINNIEVTAHSDGSIGKPNNNFKDKRIQRTFGTKHHTGYMNMGIGSRSYLVHRIIAQAFLSDFDELLEVDHVDGNKANNDISNLRMASRGDNLRAHVTKKEGCTSKYRGVSWSKGSKRWVANCTINHKFKYLGYFNDEREAAIARDAYVFSQGFPKEGLNFPENYSY